MRIRQGELSLIRLVALIESKRFAKRGILWNQYYRSPRNKNMDIYRKKT